MATRNSIEVEVDAEATVEIQAPEAEMVQINLVDALERLAERPTARPFGRRIEAACNEPMGDVIELYGAEIGSVSEAIRVLVAKGAAVLLAERTA